VTLVWQILAAVLFFALILVSVGLHELGHFIPSKLFGVKVRQFFIGFGKTLWSRQRGETEYGVKLLPLGGYVSLVGMVPPYREGKNTWLKRLADSSREGEWEQITEEEASSGRLFYQRPVWQRLIVMAAGVTMNLVLAFCLFLGVNLSYGQYQNSQTVARVAECVDAAAAVCEPTPAALAGLAAGDTLLGLNGVRYATWADFSAALRANVALPAGAAVSEAVALPVSLLIDRPGVGELTLPTVPGAVGWAADPNDASAVLPIGYLGVVIGRERVRVGPLDTAAQMFSLVGQAAQAIVRLPKSTFEATVGLVSGAPRDESGPISVVGAARVAGEVAAVDAPLSAKIATYVSLLASINLFVAVLNLVPLLPFDGGHIAAALWEALRRAAARRRGKPDPGPVDSAKLLPVAYVVGGLLVLMGAILIVADIFNPVQLF
jgi:membrane-associated protease RseP (regulator of RpoE activity)